MRERLRAAVVPAYLLACIALGGSRQGVWFNVALELIGLVIIAWSIIAGRRTIVPQAGKRLFLLVGGLVLLFVLQLIPLPPDIWSALGGRERIAQGFELLGMALPWQSISMDRYATLATAMTLIPPIAVLCGMLFAEAYRPSWIALAILVATIAAILLGALQVGETSGAASSWYLYPSTNLGVATGFFANGNHMAALLVISIALLTSVMLELRTRLLVTKARGVVAIAAVGALAVLLVGIFLNGSLAVLLLGLPVLAASGGMIWGRRRFRTLLIGGTLGAVVLSTAIYLSPLKDMISGGKAVSFERRQTFWATTAQATGDHLPFGSGIGSFPSVYKMYEDPASVTRTYVNHAHNDYLEIGLETGLPGLFLLGLFLLWWAARTVHIWRMPVTTPYAQAATIASAALLLHSLVDYPLRTAALSAIMASLLAIMAHPRIKPDQDVADLWLTRHLSA